MLEIRDLAFRYPSAEQPALDGIDLQLERGRILGLLGPNGAGKTTLISHLAGLLSVQRGDILVGGRPLALVRSEQPTRIAIAPQDYAFYPMLSVAENLGCFAAVSRLSGARARERIAACIAFTQLERFASVRAERLSGGLKRRLNLAIALLAEPELILLDEPTAGVDPQSRAFLLDRVKALAANGTTIIYTSHYMEEIEAVADDLAILDYGRLLRTGPLANILAESAAQLLVGVEGLAPGYAIEILARFGQVQPQGSQLAVQLGSGANPTAALQALETAGGVIQMARFGNCNLEQVFMQLTHRSLRDD